MGGLADRRLGGRRSLVSDNPGQGVDPADQDAEREHDDCEARRKRAGERVEHADRGRQKIED